VLRQAALPSSDRGAILERIAAITGDGPEWAEWFRVVAAKLEWADALHVLRDLVKKVEDSRDPVAARNKGEGCIQHPGRFISSEVMRWAREHRVKLPEAPE
jgi:hypothetical protein